MNKNKITFLVILLSLFFVYCKDCNSTNYQLMNMHSTQDEVIKKALEFTSDGNRDGIISLLLTRNEHNTMFWNHVGERFTSDPGMTADLAYDHMGYETIIALDEFLKDFGGKQVEMIEYKCNRKEVYGPFTLHLGCLLKFKESSTGKAVERHTFRTLIEYKGNFKLYHLRRE